MDGRALREPDTRSTGIDLAAPLDIVIVNNASGMAFQATERRFRRLLDRATHGRGRIQVGVLAGAPCAEAYGAVAAEHLLDGPQQVVVVTGAEPSRCQLQDEPFWPDLVRLLRWAESTRTPLLLSCLAAHAVMLHAAGVRRVLRARKLFGVYLEEIAADDAFTDGLPRTVPMPHSRWGTLAVEDLEAAGCRILSRSDAGGAGLFVLDRGVPWLCLQGHPEYGCNSLAGEYARDLARFERGEQSVPPDLPEISGDAHAATSSEAWRGPAAQVIRNWLATLHAVRPQACLIDDAGRVHA